MSTDLTKINSPFGNLPRETQLALFNAWLDGIKIQHYSEVMRAWMFSGHPAWHNTTKYRAFIPLTKPSINWDHVASKFNYLARDRIAVWHHGHTHYRQHKTVNNVPVIINPRGYPGENPDWKPLRVTIE